MSEANSLLTISDITKFFVREFKRVTEGLSESEKKELLGMFISMVQGGDRWGEDKAEDNGVNRRGGGKAGQ